MWGSEVLEIGQDDFLVVLQDYRAARISWNFVLHITDNLSEDKSSQIKAIEEGFLATATDYLLNVLIFDSILAICRLADHGANDRVNFLRLKAHLVTKCDTLNTDGSGDSSEMLQLKTAISELTKFRALQEIENLRERRNGYLAHRLDDNSYSTITNGEVDKVMEKLDGLVRMLAPLFRASSGFPLAPINQYSHHIGKFWKAVELGAPRAKLARLPNTNEGL